MIEMDVLVGSCRDRSTYTTTWVTTTAGVWENTGDMLWMYHAHSDVAMLRHRLKEPFYHAIWCTVPMTANMRHRLKRYGWMFNDPLSWKIDEQGCKSIHMPMIGHTSV